MMKTKNKKQMFYVLPYTPKEKQTSNIREIAVYEGSAEQCCNQANDLGEACILDDRGFVTDEFYNGYSWKPSSAVLGPKMVSRILIFKYLNGDTQRIPGVDSYNIFENEVTGICKFRNKDGKFFFKDFTRSLEGIEELVIDRRIVVEIFRP